VFAGNLINAIQLNADKLYFYQVFVAIHCQLLYRNFRPTFQKIWVSSNLQTTSTGVGLLLVPSKVQSRAINRCNVYHIFTSLTTKYPNCIKNQNHFNGCFIFLCSWTSVYPSVYTNQNHFYKSRCFTTFLNSEISEYHKCHNHFQA